VPDAPEPHSNGSAPVAAPTVVTAPRVPSVRKLDNWLRGFLDYCADIEPPIAFIRWTGLSTIAGAAQRKLYAETLAYVAYSNLFVCLVGPPGVKKSTAIYMGRRLLEQVPTIHLSADAPSVVGLMKDFADIAVTNKEHQSLNAFIYELSSLYENAKESMTGFLTTIYDGKNDYVKRTRIGDKESIARPWLNLISGTTPTWLGDNLSRSAVEGGLVARHLYVWSDELSFKSPFPEYTLEHKELEKALVHDLAHISALYGAFSWAGGRTGDAYLWYDKWYRNPARIPTLQDNRTIGYYVRKPQHLLKVAMLMGLSTGDDLLFTTETLELAMAMLETIEAGMVQAFRSVGGNIFATDLERVANQIHSCGRNGMTHEELMVANYHQLDRRNLEEILAYLVGMGRVKKGKINHPTTGVWTGEFAFVAAVHAKGTVS
jgi:hypothetical protein